MTMTFRTQYGNYVQGLIREDSRLWFDFFSKSAALKTDCNVGPVTVQVFGNSTAATPAYDALIDNGVANTAVSVTVASRATSFHLDEANINSFEAGDYGFLDKLSKSALDAVLVGMADAANDLIYTGTPANSETITGGYANFAALTTSNDTIMASAYLFNDHIAAAVGPVLRSGGQDPSKIVIICAKTAYDNLLGISNMTNLGIGNNLKYNDDTGVLKFKGIPIYASSATEETNWGVVSKECLYVLHQDSFFAKVARMKVQGDGIIYDGTAVPKMNIVTVYGLGVLNDSLQGMCVNSAS